MKHESKINEEELILNIPCIMQKWLCVCICCIKFDFNEKLDPHTLQVYGFSPVCVRICQTKTDFCEKDEPHTSQEWIIKCQSHPLEGQEWYDLTHCCEDKEMHTFPKGISPKVNAIA